MQPETKDCPRCGDELMSGKCYRCEEQLKQIRVYGIQRLGGLKAFERFTAEQFKPSRIQQPAFDAAKLFNHHHDNLYLYGPVGTGKSHLATIAARRSLGKGSIRTLKPSEISLQIRSAHNAAAESAILQEIMDTQVLVIDDLGTAKYTDFLVGILYAIVENRLQNHLGGMIVTSNLSLSELHGVLGEDRITSRLFEMCKGKIFSMVGEPDHRIGRP